MKLNSAATTATFVALIQVAQAGENVCYITALVNDVKANLAQYLPYVAQIPPALMDLAIKAQTYTDDSYTTLITPGFPYSEIESLVTVFPFYSTRLSAALAAGDAGCTAKV